MRPNETHPATAHVLFRKQGHGCWCCFRTNSFCGKVESRKVFQDTGCTPENMQTKINAMDMMCAYELTFDGISVKTIGVLQVMLLSLSPFCALSHTFLDPDRTSLVGMPWPVTIPEMWTTLLTWNTCTSRRYLVRVMETRLGPTCMGAPLPYQVTHHLPMESPGIDPFEGTFWRHSSF